MSSYTKMVLTADEIAELDIDLSPAAGAVDEGEQIIVTLAGYRGALAVSVAGATPEEWRQWDRLPVAIKERFALA